MRGRRLIFASSTGDDIDTIIAHQTTCNAVSFVGNVCHLHANQHCGVWAFTERTGLAAATWLLAALWWATAAATVAAAARSADASGSSGLSLLAACRCTSALAALHAQRPCLSLLLITIWLLVVRARTCLPDCCLRWHRNGVAEFACCTMTTGLDCFDVRGCSALAGHQHSC